MVGDFIAVLVLNYLLVNMFLPERPQQRIDVPYTFFKQQVSAGNVSEVTSRADVIQHVSRSARLSARRHQCQALDALQTVRPEFADPGLETLLNQQNVIINARPIEEPRSGGRPCC